VAEPPRRDYAVAVVGLGGIGSGAAYWLSRRLGADVLGLEQFELGHSRGASQDHSRIIRLSYHRPDYVRLAKRAYETWELLQAESGVQVVTTTGGLDLWPAGARIPMSDYSGSLRSMRPRRCAAGRNGGWPTTLSRSFRPPLAWPTRIERTLPISVSPASTARPSWIERP